MIFTKVEITNWKNFSQVSATLGNRVFLIGPNASGKSNFLDVFRFLKAVAENGLAQAVEDRGGISYLRSLSARNDTNITIHVEVDDVFVYELSFNGKRGVPVSVVHEKAYKRDRSSGKLEELLVRPDDRDLEDPLLLTQTAMEQIAQNAAFREVVDFFKTVSYQHLLPQVVRDPKGFSPHPVHNDAYGRDFVYRIWNTSAQSRRSRLRRICDALKIAVPTLDGLDVDLDKKTGIPHLIAEYKHWRAINAKQNEASFSDGTLRLLALLWMILDTHGPLLIEEPELSLHSEVVKVLPSVFSRINTTKNRETRQVIVSTHSEELLSDPGIGPGEILILCPTRNGTEIQRPTEDDERLMRTGLSAADVVLPKTSPGKVEQLSLFSL